MSQEKRRLAAIMFTDMVGYTALGQKNESLSLALVEEQRKLIRPILSRHNGREIKTIGDAFLVEFPSALDAVRCAYDIQRATREFNFSVSAEKRIHLRAGLHLGDVLESQSDISGDAVNVASRIEALAEDGGVCLTRQVYDHVSGKFELQMSSLGLKPLRNVSSPIEVFKIDMPWERSATSEGPTFPANRIAILPFASFSLDPNDGFFADGITDEIISTVSGIGGLSVISRTSVTGYKGTTKKVEEIGRELKVGSILEGSFKKAGNRIRVTTQLIDVAGDRHLWAQSYDRDLNDVFAVQCDVAKKVADALKVQLLPNEKSALEKKATENTEAYTLYLKGRYYWNERSKEGNDKAVRYFESAVALDPHFALAYAGLSDCFHVYGDHWWLKPTEAFPRAREFAMKSIELDPNLAEPHASLGTVIYHYDWKWKDAEEELVRAIVLKPNYALAHQWYSVFLRLVGRFEESYEECKKAADLDPLSLGIRTNLGVALRYLGRTVECTEHLKKLVDAKPEYAYAHAELGFSYYFDGRPEDAISEMRTAVTLSGDDTRFRADLAFLLGLVGNRDEATALLDGLKELSKTAYVSMVALAEIQYILGQYDEAFGYLERAYEERSADLAFVETSRHMSDLRKDPRWVSFEKRLGLVQD